MSVCDVCGHARAAHSGGRCTICERLCAGSYSTAINVAGPNSPTRVAGAPRPRSPHPLAGSSGPLHKPEKPKRYEPTPSGTLNSTPTRKRTMQSSTPRPTGPRRTLIEFVREHLSTEEQEQLLLILERAHRQPTYGPDISRRFAFLVTQFVDLESARHYHAALVQRQSEGKPFIQLQ
jgi:hypothetical protein